MELLKLLSTNEILAQALNFLLLVFLLRVFFWKRILKLLDERKERLAKGLKDIEDTKNEVARLRADYETKLLSIEEISRTKIREAMESGEKMAEQIQKEANIEADRIINSAELDVKYQIAKAKEELKKEIVNLTITASQNLIREKLGSAEDKKLVEDFLDQVKSQE